MLVGADNQRILWPMARILELIPGRDGIVRVARVKTQRGSLPRPLQRLYPLEMSSSDADSIVDSLEQHVDAQRIVPGHCDTDVVTRSGHRVSKPKRLVE